MRQILGKSQSGLFATRTITGHVIRGAIAFTLLYVAIVQQHTQFGLSLVSALLALAMMRGCPVCWTIGLVETIQQRLSKLRTTAEQ